MTLTETAWSRFAGKFIVYDPTGCWLWTAAVDKDGYGLFYVGGGRNMLGAHRVAYMHFVGPIPDGEELDHVAEKGCRFRNCVNPAHLEPVSHLVNVGRGRAGKWQVGL